MRIVKRLCSGLAVAASLLVLGSAAHAATIMVTYQGVITSGYDGEAKFGATSSAFVGQSYTATIMVDDTVPGGEIINYPGAYSGFACQDCDSYASGSFQVGGATLQINNQLPPNALVTAHLEWASESLPDPYLLKYKNSVESIGSDQSWHVLNFYWASKSTQPLPYLYTSPFSFVAAPGESLGNGAITLFDAGGAYTYANLSVLSISTSPAGGAVPEPATWALMLCGFFGAGAALRGQRTRRATAA